jgi:adenosylhomocysteine nucleosidase
LDARPLSQAEARQWPRHRVRPVTHLKNIEPSSRLLFVSELKREAAIARGPDTLSICGSDASLCAKLAETTGPLRLTISFGLCGGLDPALQSGDIVIGTQVLAGGGAIKADETVSRELAARLGAAGERVSLGAVVGVDAPVLTRGAKAKLRNATMAVAVDMQSQIVARFAADRKGLFAILRVVSDPADRDLPPLVTKAVRSDGSVDLGAVALALINSPAQTPGLIAAARDSAVAFATLRRCRRLPGLFAGLGLAHL